MKLQKDLREFIGLLNSTKIKYLLVGGHAVAHHGFPRFTGDIDFFIEATRENLELMQAVLRDFGFPSLGQSLLESSPGTLIQLGRPPNRIDLLTAIDGVGFDEAWITKEAAMLDGLEVPLISKKLLIRNKKSTGRPKDLEDVRQLGA
ncbi:MAG: hypothetical protein JWM99_2243 [Verrucomicrobiales bacterium]|nr:hypothetical protein [Verrucomicrobiales bacterium]